MTAPACTTRHDLRAAVANGTAPGPYTPPPAETLNTLAAIRLAMVGQSGQGGYRGDDDA